MRPVGGHLDDRNAGWLAITAPRGGDERRAASGGPLGMPVTWFRAGIGYRRERGATRGAGTRRRGDTEIR